MQQKFKGNTFYQQQHTQPPTKNISMYLGIFIPKQPFQGSPCHMHHALSYYTFTHSLTVFTKHDGELRQKRKKKTVPKPNEHFKLNI